MLFKRIRLSWYLHKLLNKEVHKKYTLKIQSGIGMNCDKNSDAEANAVIVQMIMDGNIDKNNISQICETYMSTRENIIMGNGGITRWVKK